MKKKFIYILSLFFSLVSCDEYLDVNNNIDGPAYADGYLYLANITQQYQGVYWDVRAIAPMAQMWGTTSYTAFANNFYYLGSDSGAEIWRMTYWNQGQNLENMINQSEAAEDWTLAGIGYAMKAFSWDMLTKVHGELPMTDAFVPDLLSHDYDYQKDIYAQVREWAYTAVELLERADNTVYADKISSNDFIYGGDKAKWIKFAYAVIVRNLSSLSNKTDFVGTYAQELIDAANQSFQSPDDDATVSVAGGSQSAPFSSFNNFWGTARRNLHDNYFQHEYAVQVFTGTVPKYDEATGDKTNLEFANDYYPYVLADKQIITDTLVNELGHFDPRASVKLSTISNPNYENLSVADSVKAYKYFGGSFTSSFGPIGQAPSVYGRHATTSAYEGSEHDGTGRWLFRDDAPYVLTTYAEIQFCLAEAYWKTNQTTLAFDAFKRGVSADMQSTAKYIKTGSTGTPTGGDKITSGLFNTLASEYLDGPYVGGLTDFSLSHIMMQKWVALYPWGAPEAWVDMRKYHFDVEYSGDYPTEGNGWSQAVVEQKWDTDPSKVFKGLYLAPAQVQGRKGSYSVDNNGSPSYRIRPRFNSEYMWNVPSLEVLKPISGTDPGYHTSIPYFAYPGEQPQ